jgi:hypothetical protein
MLNGLWTGGALDCPTRDLQSSISGIVALVLRLDLDHEPDRARRAFERHLSRAKMGVRARLQAGATCGASA